MSRLTVLLALLLLGGCETLSDIVSTSDRPDATVVGAALRNLSLDGAEIDFDLEVDNPYAVALPLVNLDYALKSKGNQFVAGDVRLDGVVPARGSRVVTLPAAVRFDDLMRVLGDVRPGAVVPYEADLALGVDAPGIGPLSLPLRHEGRLPVPAVPRIEVESFDIEQLSLTEARGLLKLRVDNTNQFDADLQDMQYRFALAGTPIAESSLRRGVALPAGGDGILEIPLSFAPSQAGLAMLDVLRGNAAAFEIGGRMQLNTPFGPLDLPFERSGTTPLNRN